MNRQDALAAALRQLKRNRLRAYRPYPKQYEFHRAGLTFRQRLLLKGNRAGGTIAAANEVAMHLTGKYPEWWPGRRYDGPVVLVTGSESNESSRDIIQNFLFGTKSANMKSGDFGTGTIPGDDIEGVSTRQAGIKDVMESARIRHASGGTSTVLFKSYEQGRSKVQGFAAKIAWADEQTPPDFYSEMLARTMAEPDGMTLLTFTALKGETDVVRRFLKPGADSDPVHTTRMSIYDAIGGIWPDGTPWAGQSWKGHFTKEEAEKFVASFPEHERETRAHGEPMWGEGLVFPFAPQVYTCQPFEIPRWFARIKGIDFGIDHPFALAELAWDRDQDVIYLVRIYRRAGMTVAIQVPVINGKNRWVPVAWPHDGMNREKKGGEPLAEAYMAEGASMLPISARYDDDVGSSQAVEPVVMELYDRIASGRFKAFSTCAEFFEEMRSLHREDGKIVPVNDDAIKAVLYALMMKRHATTEPMPIKRAGFDQPILTQWG